MTGASARQRASIAISFGVQAAMIAALLGVRPLESAHPVQAARAAPPSATAVAPATPVSSMRLVIMLGLEYGFELPPGRAVPPHAYAPPGRDFRVVVTIVSPGRYSATNAWFAIARASGRHDQLTQQGTSMESMSRVKPTVLPPLPPGMPRFLIIVPAADLQHDSSASIVMGVQQGSRQVTYGIAQLNVP
jgi:hypothetical protein